MEPPVARTPPRWRRVASPVPGAHVRAAHPQFAGSSRRHVGALGIDDPHAPRRGKGSPTVPGAALAVVGVARRSSASRSCRSARGCACPKPRWNSSSTCGGQRRGARDEEARRAADGPRGVARRCRAGARTSSARRRTAWLEASNRSAARSCSKRSSRLHAAAAGEPAHARRCRGRARGRAAARRRSRSAAVNLPARRRARPRSPRSCRA